MSLNVRLTASSVSASLPAGRAHIEADQSRPCALANETAKRIRSIVSTAGSR